MAELKVKAFVRGDIRWAGYYELKRRKPGEIFNLSKKSDFSAEWMEPIGWTPEAAPAARVEAFKTAVRPATGAIDAKKSGFDVAKDGKKVSLSQIAGKAPIAADNPVPEDVKEINTEDTSPNKGEVII